MFARLASKGLRAEFAKPTGLANFFVQLAQQLMLKTLPIIVENLLKMLKIFQQCVENYVENREQLLKIRDFCAICTKIINFVENFCVHCTKKSQNNVENFSTMC